MFPEELNRFLRGQIRFYNLVIFYNDEVRSEDSPKDYLAFAFWLGKTSEKPNQALTQVNGQLLRVLEERESELQAYVDQNQRFSMTMPGLAGTSRASEMAASKIVELSKRVRELTAEVEGHKSRHRAAEAKLAQYIEASQTALSSQKKEQSQDNGEKQEDQVRMLTEKLNSTSSKLYECRNQCQQLKQDLKMAQKVVSSEIGDNVSIHSLTSGNSNWRGRAQQIIALQQKISELKERLGEHNDDKTVGCNKGMTTLRQIERERRAAHEQTERELKDVNAQLEDSKKKADGARARVKILEGELASVKGKLKTILEKGSHDDQLIKALTDGGQYQVLGLVAEAERVRLIELLAVTNRRLEEQRKKAEDAEA
ncbi:hypothetical protein ANN_21213, partial [Periplaneta americana]